MSPVFTFHLALFVHLLAATWLIGSSLFIPFARSAMRRASTAGGVRAWLDFEHRATRLNPVAALLVLASGLYLGSRIGWPSGWFHVAIGAWALSSVIAAALVPRLHAGLLAHLAEDPHAAVSDEADRQRWSAAWRLVGGALLANDLALLYLMIRKPDLTASLVVLAAANATAALVSMSVHRPASSSAPVADEATLPSR